MMITKNVLVTTILLAQCFFCIRANEVSSHHHAENSIKFDDFKNKDIIIKNIIPDVSSLTTSVSDSNKYESLNGLLMVWTSVLHDDGHFEITKGKIFNFIKIYFICVPTI